MLGKQLAEMLEKHQISIYFGAIILALLFSAITPKTTQLYFVINPALAFMLFVTFLQMPLAKVSIKSLNRRFLCALLTANFIVVPLLVLGLVPFMPNDPIITLGILLVLLTPCIDYVVTFSHLGKADSRLLLMATPALLVMQMLLLPLYLKIFSGHRTSELILFGPFIQAFVWLIAVPFILAACIQKYAVKSKVTFAALGVFSVLPVPATAQVLFLVVASVVPTLGDAGQIIIEIIPIYIAYAFISPLLGWFVGRCFRLETPAGRAIAFSAGTRNSLVILPLALSIPDALPLLPAIIVTQMLVELLAEMVYIKLISKLKYQYDTRK